MLEPVNCDDLVQRVTVSLGACVAFFAPLARAYQVYLEVAALGLGTHVVLAHQRSEKSHAIAQCHRPALEKIAAVYGPNEAGRAELAQRVAQAYRNTPDIVGVDTTLKENAPRAFLRIQRQRAESLGIPVQVIAQTVHAALSGADAAYLHDGQAKYPVPVRLQLPLDAQVGLDSLLALPMKAASTTSRK